MSDEPRGIEVNDAMDQEIRIAAIIVRDGKVLLLKGRDHQELWTLGGRIEPGETDEMCLRREIKEEINAELERMTFFKEYAGPSFYHPDRTLIQRVYIVSAIGEFQPRAEIEGIIWLSRREFEDRAYPMIPITEKEIIPDLIARGMF